MGVARGLGRAATRTAQWAHRLKEGVLVDADTLGEEAAQHDFPRVNESVGRHDLVDLARLLSTAWRRRVSSRPARGAASLGFGASVTYEKADHLFVGAHGEHAW